MPRRKNIDWFYLTHDSRAQVYLLWAIICAVGFVTTHYVQRQSINPFWLMLTLIGLWYMRKVMPLKVEKMRKIMWSWVVPLAFGMMTSVLVFFSASLAQLIPYLGVFWMAVMAVGFLWNGLVDRPIRWYVFAFAINIFGAAICFYYPQLLQYQYLVAAIVSTWSMTYLWLLRT